MSSNFLSILIQEELKLRKESNKYKKFDTFLKTFLSEADQLNPAEPETQAAAATAAPQTPPEQESALPPKDALIKIQLVKLAVAAFLTDIESIKKDPSLETKVNNALSFLDDVDEQLSNPEVSKKAISTILNLVKLKDGGQYHNLQINFDDLFHKMNAASRSLMVGTCVKALLTPLNKIQDQDPFLTSTIESMPDSIDDMNSLDKNPAQLEAAVKAADEVYNKLKTILSTNSTGSMLVSPGA